VVFVLRKFLFFFIFLGSLTHAQGIYSNNTIGFENVNNSVWHIWNEKNDYWFNSTSGMQITNHYSAYWTHNYFCGAVQVSAIPTEYCIDSLPLNWKFQSNNVTYANITGTYRISVSGTIVNFTLQYQLGSNDDNLTILFSVQNMGTSAITRQVLVSWISKDIKVGYDQKYNYIQVDGRGFYLNITPLNYVNASLVNPIYYLYNNATNQYLEFGWNKSIAYNVTVKNQTGQYNAPVKLTQLFGGLAVGQKKTLRYTWIDAICNVVTCTLSQTYGTGDFYQFGHVSNSGTISTSQCGTNTRTLTLLGGDNNGGSTYTISATANNLTRVTGVNPRTGTTDLTTVTVEWRADKPSFPSSNHTVTLSCQVATGNGKVTAPKNYTVRTLCDIVNQTTPLTLTANVSRCYEITTNNTWINCAGYWINGNQSGAIPQIYAHEASNITIANCSFFNTSLAIKFLNVNNSVVYNNTVYLGLDTIRIAGKAYDNGGFIFSGGYNLTVYNNFVKNVTSILAGDSSVSSCWAVTTRGFDFTGVTNVTAKNNSVAFLHNVYYTLDDSFSCGANAFGAYGLYLSTSDYVNSTFYNFTINYTNQYNAYFGAVNVTLNNSNFSNGKSNVLWFAANANVTFLNTTFNHTAAAFNKVGGNLTVLFYLYINSSSMYGNVPDSIMNITGSLAGIYKSNLQSNSFGEFSYQIVPEYIEQMGVGNVTYDPLNLTLDAVADVEITSFLIPFNSSVFYNLKLDTFCGVLTANKKITRDYKLSINNSDFYANGDAVNFGQNVCFFSNVSDVVLDCQGKNITNIDVSLDGFGYGNKFAFLWSNATSNVTVKNCDLTNFTEAIKYSYSIDGKIFNNTIRSTGKGSSSSGVSSAGIYLLNVNSSYVTNNSILNSERHGIWVTGYSNGIVIYNNRVVNLTSLFGSSAGGYGDFYGLLTLEMDFSTFAAPFNNTIYDNYFDYQNSDYITPYISIFGRSYFPVIYAQNTTFKNNTFVGGFGSVDNSPVIVNHRRSILNYLANNTLYENNNFSAFVGLNSFAGIIDNVTYLNNTGLNISSFYSTLLDSFNMEFYPIKVGYYSQINATDYQKRPISGVQITIRNITSGSGSMVVLTTGSDGLTPVYPFWEFMINGSFAYGSLGCNDPSTSGNILCLTPHNVTGVKAGYSSNSSNFTINYAGIFNLYMNLLSSVSNNYALINFMLPYYSGFLSKKFVGTKITILSRNG
jgi:hypothetical protein